MWLYLNDVCTAVRLACKESYKLTDFYTEDFYAAPSKQIPFCDLINLCSLLVSRVRTRSHKQIKSYSVHHRHHYVIN